MGVRMLDFKKVFGLPQNPSPDEFSLTPVRSAQELLMGQRSAESNTPVVLAPLILDVSESVKWAERDINFGVAEYVRTLKVDDLSSVAVRAMLVQVSTGVRMTPYESIAEFAPPKLVFGGRTDLGDGIVKTLDATDAEMKRLASIGRPLNRIGMSILTDGYPSDDTTEAIERLQAFEQHSSSVSVFPIAVGDAAYDFLKKLSTRTPPARLKNEPGSFTALLRWLAQLHGTYSRSRPGEIVPTPPTDAWRESQ
jgi:uncharacterized protein YegL